MYYSVGFVVSLVLSIAFVSCDKIHLNEARTACGTRGGLIEVLNSDTLNKLPRTSEYWLEAKDIQSDDTRLRNNVCNTCRRKPDECAKCTDQLSRIVWQRSNVSMLNTSLFLDEAGSNTSLFLRLYWEKGHPRPGREKKDCVQGSSFRQFKSFECARRRELICYDNLTTIDAPIVGDVVVDEEVEITGDLVFKDTILQVGVNSTIDIIGCPRFEGEVLINVTLPTTSIDLFKYNGTCDVDLGNITLSEGSCFIQGKSLLTVVFGESCGVSDDNTAFPTTVVVIVVVIVLVVLLITVLIFAIPSARETVFPFSRKAHLKRANKP
mmetsp:Transcript_15361/g.17095  ORF Transcript_15361/g.17095 Transcript_15361/m.17095 type:complete len:323 (+) Transcript_15361:21-989(+)